MLSPNTVSRHNDIPEDIHSADIAGLNTPIQEDIDNILIFGLGKKVLGATPISPSELEAMVKSHQGADLMTLENLLSDMRKERKYVQSPLDALKILNLFHLYLGATANKRKVLSLLRIVGEYIGKQDSYSMSKTQGDHDKVNILLNTQALLTENLYSSLEDSGMQSHTGDESTFSLQQPNDFITNIRKFLSAADTTTAERVMIQNIGEILYKILGIDGSPGQTEWGIIIRHAQTYMGKQQ